MTDCKDAVDLASLDEAPAAPLDPAVWSANLAALARRDPALAQRLEETPVPTHWRSVRALDGFVTFRIEEPGQPPAWLANTAAPLARAEAFVGQYQAGELNATLPAIATGAELKLLLQRLPPHKAVFVFESEMAPLAAVLRTVALAAELDRCRCTLVAAEKEVEHLTAVLEAEPGLLPPGNILCVPGVTAERLEHVRRVCEEVCRATLRRRAERLERLVAAAQEPARTRADPHRLQTGATTQEAARTRADPHRLQTGATTCRRSRPRLAALALTPERVTHLAAAALESAAKSLGWTACARALRDPRDAHALGHCGVLAEFRPNLTVCINHPRTALPLPLAGTICEWYLRAADVPRELPDDGTLRLSATPRVTAALRAAGAPGVPIADFFWGCDCRQDADAPDHCRQDADAPDRASASKASSPPHVVLLTQRPDDRPEACGIEQPTHLILWRQLHTVATELSETTSIYRPEGLMVQAERACGLRFDEPALRAHMLRQIEAALIPAVVLDQLRRALERHSVPVDELGDELPSRLSDTPAPLAAIVAGHVDPLAPAVLYAAALGWPLLVHSPGGESRSAALGGILEPDRHFQPFTGARDLWRTLERLQREQQSAARMAERARAHVSGHHSYARRLESLWEFVTHVGDNGPPTATIL